jgi:hypothetical protein
VACLHVAAAIAMAVGLASRDHWMGLDTMTVLGILAIFGILSWPAFLGLVQSFLVRRNSNTPISVYSAR